MDTHHHTYRPIGRQGASRIHVDRQARLLLRKISVNGASDRLFCASSGGFFMKAQKAPAMKNIGTPLSFLVLADRHGIIAHVSGEKDEERHRS